MAKGNMLQGQATGKVGDIVFMVRNGQQVARVYTSAGGRSGDQASIAVRRQRVRFGAASNQYLLYRNIVRGMYRTGKSTKQSDYNFFVRENVDLLPYLTREENAAGVKCVMPGTFSRGTLGNLGYTLTYELGDSDVPKLTLGGAQSFGDTAYGPTSLVSAFKAGLKTVFPLARKVNFCLCAINKVEVSLPSGSQYSHQIERYDVIFDLYDEDANVPDSSKIEDYFDYYVGNEGLKNMWGPSATFQLLGNNLFRAVGVSDADQDLYASLYVNVFATNDQVGDCYSSTMYEIVAADSDGGLSLYNTLRTDNHRQVAEDSYGYATGVMRTNIQQA